MHTNQQKCPQFAAEALEQSKSFSVHSEEIIYKFSNKQISVQIHWLHRNAEYKVWKRYKRKAECYNGPLTG